MRYYNADGGEAEMCGNGARCFARFATRLENTGGGTLRETLRFETQAGLIQARLDGERVRLDMSQPAAGMALGCARTRRPDAAGGVLPQHGRAACRRAGPRCGAGGCLSGRPRHPLPRALRTEGHERQFRPDARPGGDHPADVRARGGRQTLACGTGATASALIHAERLGLRGSFTVAVRVRSGDVLEIGGERVGPFDFRDVTLGGPAEFVFNGEIAI